MDRENSEGFGGGIGIAVGIAAIATAVAVGHVIDWLKSNLQVPHHHDRSDVGKAIHP